MADENEIVDDATILDEQKFLRRIHYDWIVAEDGSPESSNFDAKRSDNGLSLTIWIDEQSLAAAQMGHDGFGLMSLTAAHLREQGFKLVRSPEHGNDHHCDAEGPVSNKSAKRLKQKAKWVVYPKNYSHPMAEVDTLDG